MLEPTVRLYIAPYGVSGPFLFTIPRKLCPTPTLEERLSSMISDMAAGTLPQSMPSVDKTLVPRPESWVLLDLQRGTLVHSSSSTAYLIEVICSTQRDQGACIVLPTTATLATPTMGKDAHSDPLLCKSFCPASSLDSILQLVATQSTNMRH